MAAEQSILVAITKVNGTTVARNQGINIDDISFAFVNGGVTKLWVEAQYKADNDIYETALTPAQLLALADASGYVQNGLVLYTVTGIKRGSITVPPGGSITFLMNRKKVKSITLPSSGSQFDYSVERLKSPWIFTIEEVIPVTGVTPFVSYWEEATDPDDIINTNAGNVLTEGFFGQETSLLNSVDTTGANSAALSIILTGKFSTIVTGAMNTGVNLEGFTAFGAEVYVNNNSGSNKFVYANTAGGTLITLATWGSSTSSITIRQGEVWRFKKVSTIWVADRLTESEAITFYNINEKYTNLGVNVQKGVEDSLIAFAGGGQASATPLSLEYSFVSTVATTADSVKFNPVSIRGIERTVTNEGANALDLFPPVGGDLGAGVDTAVSIAAGASARFVSTSSIVFKQIP